jgi:outer membrane lipoprotein-sorting protein
MPSILLIFLSFSLSWAGASTADLESLLTKYRQSKAIKAKVTKTVVQELMGTKNESQGLFYFSKGKLRLDIESPEKSTLVYDGQSIWHESRLDDSEIQVSKFKAGDLKKSDSLLASLFERKDILKNFKVLTSDDSDGKNAFTFEPKDKSKTEIRWLELVTNKSELLRIAYKDDRENKVSFDFLEVSRQAVPAKMFMYKPPKGAQVTRF